MMIRFAAGLMTLGFAVSGQAASITIASFEDPTIGQDPPTPIFFYDNTANELTAQWTGPGLTLHTYIGTYLDVTFVMDAVAGLFPSTLGAGQIVFGAEVAGTPTTLLTIEFDSAQLNAIGFGATEFMSQNVVSFSGAIVTDLIDQESFSFVFANQTPGGDDGSFTATASFTSSAEIVPEPISLLLLGTGGLVALRRTRRTSVVIHTVRI